jgi:hypothetical protein
MSERLRKLLLYQKYITFCIERELGLTENKDGQKEETQRLESLRQTGPKAGQGAQIRSRPAEVNQAESAA